VARAGRKAGGENVAGAAKFSTVVFAVLPLERGQAVEPCNCTQDLVPVATKTGVQRRNSVAFTDHVWMLSPSKEMLRT